MANIPAIQVKDLTKYYGQLLAVDNISFEVNKGEFFGFLGPNGAGKTTTLRIITGIINKSSGESSIMGFPSGSIPAKQMSGVMPELSNAYMDLTAWGNLMLMAGLYRVPSALAKERAESLLKQLGLFDRKDSPASTFSLGMRKRLVLCMALLADPEVLFLDEPSSGLDVQSSRFIRNLLKNLKQQGKTIMLTTHNMDEAAEMCDRVAIINKGKIVAEDSPDKLSITAGKTYLVDVSFDKPVAADTLAGLPGVMKVESASAIEDADFMRLQAQMMQNRPMGGLGGMMPPPEMMRMMQQRMKEMMAAEKNAARSEGAREVSKYRLHSGDTAAVMGALVDFTRANNIKILDIVVRPPSLEDAFVRLTEEVKSGK